MLNVLSHVEGSVCMRKRCAVLCYLIVLAANLAQITLPLFCASSHQQVCWCCWRHSEVGLEEFSGM